MEEMRLYDVRMLYAASCKAALDIHDFPLSGKTGKGLRVCWECG